LCFGQLLVFETPTPDTGYFELNGERRTCFMGTQPNCDPALVWRKSRRSGASGGCVEVALSKSSVLVRDSRNDLGARLGFSLAQWRHFVRRVKNGEIPPI
jgi:Domain of unknown function (DUF397)